MGRVRIHKLKILWMLTLLSKKKKKEKRNTSILVCRLRNKKVKKSFLFVDNCLEEQTKHQERVQSSPQQLNVRIIHFLKVVFNFR